MGLLLARNAFVQKHWNWSAQKSGLPPEARRLRILCSEVAHFTVEKSASQLGLGSDAVVAAFVSVGLCSMEPTKKTDMRSGVYPCIKGDLTMPGLDTLIFSIILVTFIIYEPTGLYGRWLKIRAWFQLFPLARRDMFRRQKTYLKTERMK